MTRKAWWNSETARCSPITFHIRGSSHEENSAHLRPDLRRHPFGDDAPDASFHGCDWFRPRRHHRLHVDGPRVSADLLRHPVVPGQPRRWNGPFRAGVRGWVADLRGRVALLRAHLGDRLLPVRPGLPRQVPDAYDRQGAQERRDRVVDRREEGRDGHGSRSSIRIQRSTRRSRSWSRSLSRSSCRSCRPAC